MVVQRRTAAAGGESDGRIIDADVLRVDYFVALAVLQHTILMDAGRVGEGVAAHDGLVGLHGHPHQR